MNDLGQLSQEELAIASRVRLERDLILEEDAELVLGGRRISVLVSVYGRFADGIAETRDDEGEAGGFEIERVMLGSGPDARDVTAVLSDSLDVINEVAMENT